MRILIITLVKLTKIFSQVHVQNAALAGGVIMGANADFLVQPCIALVMGSVAGIVSVLGYFYVQVSKKIFREVKINMSK